MGHFNHKKYKVEIYPQEDEDSIYAFKLVYTTRSGKPLTIEYNDSTKLGKWLEDIDNEEEGK